MKKNILKTICFLTIFILLLLIFSHLFIPKNNTKEYGIHNEKANGYLGEKENTIDVLVIGDSESYRTIMPLRLWKNYGYTTYICGTPDQRTSDSYAFLRKFFEKQKPKVVILEVNNLYLKDSISSPVKTAIYNMFPVLEYHDRWKTLNGNDWFKEINYTWTDDLKGFEYSTDIEPSENQDYMDYSESEENIKELGKFFVRLIKDYCKKNDTKFFMIAAPHTIDWSYERHNAVKSFAEEEQIEFIDMNIPKHRVSIDWNTETADKGYHLNYSGVRKATKFIGKYLSELNILEDHRGDENYKSWDEALERFKTMLKEDNQEL